MTIATKQIIAATALGAVHLGSTTIWDYRSASLASKQTYAHGFARHLIAKNKAQKIVALIGAKGRSQHSASEVLLYDVSTLSDDSIAELVRLGNTFTACIYDNNTATEV